MKAEEIEKLLRNKNATIEEMLPALESLSEGNAFLAQKPCAPLIAANLKAEVALSHAQARAAAARSQVSSAKFHMGLSSVFMRPDLLEIATIRYQEAEAALSIAEGNVTSAEAVVSRTAAELARCESAHGGAADGANAGKPKKAGG